MLSIQTNTQIQASDMDHILLNEFSAVSSNLQILAVSHGVQTGNATQVTPLFERAVVSTEALTSSYFWVPISTETPVVVWGTNGAVQMPAWNEPVPEDRAHFIEEVKETGTPVLYEPDTEPTEPVRHKYRPAYLLSRRVLTLSKGWW